MRKNSMLRPKTKNYAIIIAIVVVILLIMFATDFWGEASVRFEKFWLE